MLSLFRGSLSSENTFTYQEIEDIHNLIYLIFDPFSPSKLAMHVEVLMEQLNVCNILGLLEILGPFWVQGKIFITMPEPEMILIEDLLLDEAENGIKDIMQTTSFSDGEHVPEN